MKLILFVFLCLISVILAFENSKRKQTELYLMQESNSSRISLEMNSSSDKNTLIEHEVFNKNQFALYILRQDWVDSFYNEGIFSADWLTITSSFVFY